MSQILDPIRTFGRLKDAIKEGVQQTFPIETNKRELRLRNIRIDDSKANTFDYKTQKQVKLKGKDYAAPVYGDLELVDKETGEVIDTKNKFRLMDVPVLTDRFSYILGGNEYTVDKQLRLKPGIYTREKENGELESRFNLAKGGGRGFKLWMNPEDGVFKMKIGTANPALYPILKALDVEDSKMKELWGDSLFLINQGKTSKNIDKDIAKAYKAIFQKEAPGPGQARNEIKEFFDSTILSEETTKRTLGKGFAKVEPETLLLTSKRLLKVSKGEEEPDDRDSLIYKHIYDTPDQIDANITANRRKVQYDIKRIMDKKNKITEIVSKDMLNKPVRNFFIQGSVANASEQTNPTTILANATKVTSLGEGAIGDMNAVTDTMRMVNPSHAGILDPVATPESSRIGINLHLALGSTIDKKELKTLVKNPKTGKVGYSFVKDIFDLTLAFPDQYDKKDKPKNDLVTVLQSGKIRQVPPKEVDLVMETPKQIFSYLSNLVPFAGSVQGNRAFMANKMLAQALPLKYREAPLIQTKMTSGGSFESFLGKAFASSSVAPGKVKEITEDRILVDHGEGIGEKEYNLYNNFPLNNKNFVHSEPKVKVGDEVDSGDVLADTVYTKDGTLAIGTNLRVGILPFKANTFEDGYVISESASKKLTSEHLREKSVQVGREDLLDLKAFKAHYPTAVSADMMKKLGDDGVIKVGEIVEPGDIVIAHLQKTEANQEDIKLGRLSKKLIKGYRNNAQVWDKETTGKVVDVYKSKDGVKVFIRTEEPMQIGDKLVNRHGAKGIVSKVVPDNEMPATADGKALEVAVSPSAIPGRINPSQVLEAAASKVARKWGRPLKIDNFADIDSVKEIKGLLDKEGLKDKEELIDPTTGQSLGKVMIGDQYYLKLMHQVSKKINARGIGPNYDIDKQPSKGGNTSAQAMDRLTWNSLIAHGARENLFEMTAYKAEKNPELWRNVKLGYPLPAPKTPFVFNKLTGYLAAGGVNVKKDGNRMFMMPLTDKEILERSNGAIDDAKVVVSKNLRPVKDGLFDEVKTGGLSGEKWTHIPLAEPILNPVMEKAALSLLEMTEKQLKSVVSGSLYYDKDKKELTEDNTGLTSGPAIKAMLSEIDVDKEYSTLKEKAKRLTGQGLDKANKKLRFLRALRLAGNKADEAYMLENLPVLPPKFRPMFPLPNGSLNSAPLNYLYRDLIMVNKQLKDLDFLDDDMKTELRRDLYQAAKATQGLGDPLVQRGEKRIVGAIDMIKGKQPKEGYFQSVVFSKNQDLSGRSTITPSTEMSPDEIMMPKDMAWNIYQPFVVKELTKMGYKTLDADIMVENRDPKADFALEKVSRERPVWLNRAPSLHKFSVLAMQPKLYNGKSIKLHPLVVGGYTADFDGDSCIDACFLAVDTKKWKDSTSGIDNMSDLEYYEYVDRFTYLRRAQMPANVRIPLLQEETLIHVNLEDFPRIESSKRTTDKGTICYDVPSGIRVVTIDNETQEPVLVDVTEYSIHPDLDSFHIEASDGSNLWLSNDHSAITIDTDTFALTKTKPEELEGKVMAKVKNVNIEDTVKEVPLIDYAIAAKVRTKDSVQLTSDLGHFIGMMVGDGWISNNRVSEYASHICFANINDNLAKKFEDGVNSMLSTKTRRCSVEKPHDYKGYSCKSTTHSIGAASLASNIKEWIGHGALDKHLPPFFMSAPKEFRLGLLAGLIDTDGSSRFAQSKGKKAPQYNINVSTISPRLSEEIVTLCRTLGINASITDTRQEHRVIISAMSVHNAYNKGDVLPLAHPDKLEAYQEYCNKPLSKEVLKSQATRMDFVPFSKALKDIANPFLSKKRGSSDMGLYNSMNRAAKNGYISRLSAKLLIEKCPDMPQVWIDIVNNEDVTWVYATKITKAPRKVTMYDITAPGPYTFMTSSGIIVQDTMATYVPVSNKAVEEAKNYFPTRVMEHAADNRIMLSPGHDIMTGLFYLSKRGKDLSNKKKYASLKEAMKDYKTKNIEIFDTVTIDNEKTSIGRALIRQVLPSDVPIPTDGFSKKTIKGFLDDLAKKGPDIFRDSMDKLSKLSSKYNIYSSISIGLDDLTPDYEGRSKILSETRRKLKRAKTDDDKREIISSMLPKFHGTVNNYLDANPDNALSQLMRANGKPSFDQFKQLISTPFAVSDEKGHAVPMITTKSFAEGLPVSEYWTTTYGSRAGMIQKRMATADPGYFAKQILSVTIDNVISEEDCKTTKGVDTNVKDKGDVVGRYEAGTNRLIDEDAYTQLLKSGKETIKLRSPLTCQVKEGTCSMCYGLRENGQPAKIGDNVGALAGQFFTEPTTQGSMKAFHCMEKGMLLFLRLGGQEFMSSFEDLWDNWYGPVNLVNGQEEKYIKGLEVWDNGKWTPAHRVIRHKRHKESPMVMTRSQSNRFVISQDNHPHMLKDKNTGEHVEVMPKDIEKNKYECISSFPIWQEDKLKPFYPAYFIGLYVTDGGLSFRRDTNGSKIYNGVSLYQNEDSIVCDSFREAIKSLPFDGKVNIRKRINSGGRTGLIFTKYGRDLGEYFHNMCGAEYYKKHLPYEFISYTDEDLAQALCGIIDGDGCVIPVYNTNTYRTSISIEIASTPLIQQICLICDKFGLTYRVSASYRNKNSRRQPYCVVIYPKVGDKQYFKYSKKMQLRGTYNNTGNTRNTDDIKYIKEIYFNDDNEYVYDLTTKTHTLTVNGFWTHNTGAVLGSGAQVSGGLERLQQLTLVPSYLKDKATLAEKSGKVERIEDNPAGGKNIYINNKKHLAGVRNILKVKEGDEVNQGDPLTDGPIKPQELLKLKGIGSTQKYLVDSMKDTFKGMGKDMNRKLLETVVRSTTNSTVIEDPGDHPYYVPGDVAPLTEIQNWNTHDINEIDVSEALDSVLAVGVGPYSAGTKLDRDKIKALKTLGIEQVSIRGGKIRHSPSIVAVNLLARMGKDWLAKLNTNYLEQVITEGVQTGDRANTKSYNPTGPYVLGTTFGKDDNKKGKY